MWINETTRVIEMDKNRIRQERWRNGVTLPDDLTDEVLAANGWSVIIPTPPVGYDPLLNDLVENIPFKDESGQWRLTFTITMLDAAVAEARRISSINYRLSQGNQAIISALMDGDTARIDAWRIEAAALRAQL